MLKGKIIFFNKKTKFGFIKDIIEYRTYYVSEKNLIDEIKENDEVEFELKDSKKGPEAIAVKLIRSL